MKIGIFDSGLGGLIVAHGILERLPQYDYHYLGDTARVPYGNRSKEIIYQFTQEAIAYLFEAGCHLVILACNTASAEALRRIQQEYLPQFYPNRRVLGVLIPAVEAALEATKSNRIGVLATVGTVNSGAFIKEIHKLKPETELYQQAAPLLVPLIETGSTHYAKPILYDYIKPLLNHQIDTLILGCTHFPYLENEIQYMAGSQVTVISPNRVVPAKLADYLIRHPEIESVLTQNRQRVFEATDLTTTSQGLANQLFQATISITLTTI